MRKDITSLIILQSNVNHAMKHARHVMEHATIIVTVVSMVSISLQITHAWNVLKVVINAKVLIIVPNVKTVIT